MRASLRSLRKEDLNLRTDCTGLLCHHVGQNRAWCVVSVVAPNCRSERGGAAKHREGKKNNWMGSKKGCVENVCGEDLHRPIGFGSSCRGLGGMGGKAHKRKRNTLNPGAAASLNDRHGGQSKEASHRENGALCVGGREITKALENAANQAPFVGAG